MHFVGCEGYIFKVGILGSKFQKGVSKIQISIEIFEL